MAATVERSFVRLVTVSCDVGHTTNSIFEASLRKLLGQGSSLWLATSLPLICRPLSNSVVKKSASQGSACCSGRETGRRACLSFSADKRVWVLGLIGLSTD